MDGNIDAEYNANVLADKEAQRLKDLGIDSDFKAGQGDDWNANIPQFGQQEYGAQNWMNNNGMDWITGGYNGESIEDNPSVIDKSLSQTGGQGWNSGGGGQNWRQGY